MRNISAALGMELRSTAPACAHTALAAMPPPPCLLWNQSGSGAPRLASQAGLTARGRFDKHHAEAFIVAVDIAVGHGKHIAGVHPARQVGLAHRAYPVDDALDIMFRDQTIEVVCVFADARADIVHRD